MLVLQEKYKKEVVPELMQKFKYSNISAVPTIEKVVVNVGVGRLRDNKDQEEVIKYLGLITGQKPSPRSAKKAIASFKTRKGLIVGYRVTMRGKRMYDFLSRLINTALPRTADFQGISLNSFDHEGNLTIGIKEHIVFPEMIGEDYRLLFGLEISIVTTTKKKEEGVELLRLLGVPIRKIQ